jgi:hypothetical protein
MHSRDILRKAKGDHLDQVSLRSEGSQDHQVGEASPLYWRPRVLKLTQRRPSGSSPLRSDGSCDSRAEG